MKIHFNNVFLKILLLNSTANKLLTPTFIYIFVYEKIEIPY